MRTYSDPFKVPRDVPRPQLAAGPAHACQQLITLMLILALFSNSRIRLELALSSSEPPPPQICHCLHSELLAVSDDAS